MKSAQDILYNISETSTFYGMVLDEDQSNFVQSIINPDNTIIFCDAAAGSGKTTLAVAAGSLLCNARLYNKLIYIAAPVQEHTQGYLPGSLEEKSSIYFEPLYQALSTLNINRNTSLITDNNLQAQKEGTAYIQPLTHTFLRGTNFENSVVIIDEAANFYTDELKKVLTRLHDTCKIVVIGHHGQVDLYKNPERSGFVRYLKWFEGHPHVAICKLTKNYRGWVSSHADAMPIDYMDSIEI